MDSLTFGPDDFIRCFGASREERSVIAAAAADFDFRYRRLPQTERDEVILGILGRLDGFTRVGEHRSDVWERCWSDAKQAFIDADGNLPRMKQALLADSFHSLPPGVPAINANGLHAVVGFAAELFAGAVRVALPAMTSLLVVNIGFAAISRAAPSMNLFAVGFPITVSLGFIALWLALRSLPGAFGALQDDAWSLMRQLFGG